MHFWSTTGGHHAGMRRRVGDRYQLLHPVWRDRLGETLVARDRADGNPVAVRLLPGTGPLRAGTHARLTALRGPHLAGVLDLVEHGDLLAVVSEIVPGPTVRQRLRAGRPSAGEAARVGAGVAAGLAVLHADDLLHRNLNAGNVIVTPERVVLTDFALAALGGVGLAAPAPELLAGGSPTPATDAYGLGVLLGELAGRRTPAGRIGRALRAGVPFARPSTRQVWSLLLHSRHPVSPGDQPVPVSVRCS